MVHSLRIGPDTAGTNQLHCATPNRMIHALDRRPKYPHHHARRRVMLMANVKSLIRISVLVTTILVLISGVAIAGGNEVLFEQLTRLAQLRDHEAQYHLGMLYNNGIGTSKNPKLAFELFLKSTQGNHPLAAYKVGCYYSGQFRGAVDVDKEKALAYKLTSAKAGYARAQHDVAFMYFGHNESETLKWLKSAARQGYRASLDVLVNLYYKGDFVEQDLVQSYAYFQLRFRDIPLPGDADRFLNDLKEAMTVEEIEEASDLISAFEQKPTQVTLDAYKGMSLAIEHVHTALKSIPTKMMPPKLAGVWNSDHGYIYKIEQRGEDFSWEVNSPITESGSGTIINRDVSTSWQNNDGSGKGSGIISSVDDNNRALRIEMSNGLVFFRSLVDP